MSKLSEAAQEYMDAVDAMHTRHSSTDVHGRGGIAGQAITDHCAIICHALNGRFDPVTGQVTGDMEPFHSAELLRLAQAKLNLELEIGLADGPVRSED